MDAVKILEERIQHEIDMELLREIQEKVRVDLTKEIELAEKKFNDKMDRCIEGITNKSAHGTNNL
jgi:CRISPR/Cas system-associated protein Cas10 (large subunit of type III CRISPR-Cas system)